MQIVELPENSFFQFAKWQCNHKRIDGHGRSGTQLLKSIVMSFRCIDWSIHRYTNSNTELAWFGTLYRRRQSRPIKSRIALFIGINAALIQWKQSLMQSNMIIIMLNSWQSSIIVLVLINIYGIECQVINSVLKLALDLKKELCAAA